MTRINTNVSSMIAGRVLTTQQKALQTAMTRLSTGLRINSGADDPAGLIASEVLRGQKTALSAAIDNGQRATNVISTAEGGLHEVSNLLSELENLVSSAANKGGLSDDEIAAKQLQVDSILTTINRIADSTEFAGKKLLNGTLDYKTSGAQLSAFDRVTIKSANLVEGAAKQVTIQVTASAQTAKIVGSSGVAATSAATLQITGNYGSQVFSFAGGTTASAIAFAVTQSKDLTGVSATVSGTGANARVIFNSTTYGSDAFVTVERISGTYKGTGAGTTGLGTDTGVDAKVIINGQAATANGLSAGINTANLSISVDLKAAFAGRSTGIKTFNITGGGADFSLAADVLTGRTSIGIQSVSTGSLGDSFNGKLSSIADGQTNALSSSNLGKAQRIVKSAIGQIASLRGRLGAFQKFTIDSTVNSMNVAYENTSAAESAIRDADFATETANMTRAQILVQAGTTVLRSTNSMPQNMLSLLQ